MKHFLLLLALLLLAYALWQWAGSARRQRALARLGRHGPRLLALVLVLLALLVLAYDLPSLKLL